MEDINIGDTICTESDMDPIEFTKISDDHYRKPLGMHSDFHHNDQNP